MSICLREYIWHEQNIARNGNVQAILVKLSQESRNRFSVITRKVIPLNEMAEGLAQLCSTALWKVEHISSEVGYLTEEISKPCVDF